MGVPRPAKSNKSCMLKKQMVAYFFSIDCHVATLPLQDRKTVYSEWYTNICFARRIQWNSKKGDEQTNHSSSQQCKLTQHKQGNLWPTKSLNWWIIRHILLIWHPMTSLFSHKKYNLRSQRFLTPEEVVETYKTDVLELPQSDWKIGLKGCKSMIKPDQKLDHKFLIQNIKLINLKLHEYIC